MFWVVFGLYIFILVCVWSFALLARIHAYKFKDYSPHIVPMTKMLFMALLALTLLGFYFLFMVSSDTTETSTSIQTVHKQTSEQVY